MKQMYCHEFRLPLITLPADSVWTAKGNQKQEPQKGLKTDSDYMY